MAGRAAADPLAAHRVDLPRRILCRLICDAVAEGLEPCSLPAGNERRLICLSQRAERGVETMAGARLPVDLSLVSPRAWSPVGLAGSVDGWRDEGGDDAG